MSTAQGNKLKITAVNIRSVLTENNDKLGKLNKQKSVLIRRQRLQAERAAEEKKIEGKDKGKGKGIKGVLGNVTGTVMSMKDRILNFFGYLLMGWLVDKLPSIIENLKSAYEFIEPLIKVTWKVISTIAKGLMSFGGWVGSLFNKKQAEKNVGALADTNTILEKEINSLEIPGDEDNSQKKSTKNETISKSTTNTEVSKLKPDKLNSDAADKREISQIEKESKEEIDNEESEDSFNSLLSLDPSKLLGRGGGSGENVAGEMTGNLSPIGANLESSTKGLITKVNKYVGDLKGNMEDMNVKTIIMPVEVERIVKSATNSVNSSIPLPPPLPSSSRRIA